jgi:prepilin-type N-terminal cleavage/methylation domain-containing protein
MMKLLLNSPTQRRQVKASAIRGGPGPRAGAIARGLTLIELVVVIAILAILAGAVIPLLQGVAAHGRLTAVKASLSYTREAIVGKTDSPGFEADIGRYPNSIAELLASTPPLLSSSPVVYAQTFNRDTNLGWRGPYLIAQGGVYPTGSATFTNLFGNNGDPALLDPWGDPIIIQRLTIAGGVLTFTDQTGTQHTSTSYTDYGTLSDGDYTRLISGGPNQTLDTAWTDPAGLSRSDDIVLYLNHSDPNPPSP